MKNFESNAASFVRGLPFSQVQSQSENGSILAFFSGEGVSEEAMVAEFSAACPDATTAELIRAVQVVAAGDALLAPSVTRRLIADFTREPHARTPSPVALDVLTSRETEVLTLSAYSHARISLDQVLGQTLETNHVTVDQALSGIRAATPQR